MNKYHARATLVDGEKFDSAREASRYGELKLLERAGEIADLHIHPAWVLVVNGVKIGGYTADFSYTETATGRVVVEDVKGVRTRDYVLRKKLLRALYAIEVQEV